MFIPFIYISYLTALGRIFKTVDNYNNGDIIILKGMPHVSPLIVFSLD